MLKLYGFNVSNYYNMVKFALLEKGMAFEEVPAMPSQENDYTSKSPMGKVPCIQTDAGFLSETSAILECIEASKPEPRLLPANPFAAAKVREMMKIIELYIELPARRHYPELFFKAPRNQAAFEEVKPVLENGVRSIKQLGVFKPFVCGEFSLADVYAAWTFCYAQPVAQALYGMDLIGSIPGLGAALEATNARAAGAKVLADQQAAMAAFAAQNG